MKDFEEAGFKDAVKPLILKEGLLGIEWVIFDAFPLS
jgi:hypothetical protein